MQVVERFFTLGTWRNMWRRLDLAIYDCRLTIPRGFDTCRQVAICNGSSAPIYSQFHRFAAYGVSVDPVLDGGNWVAGLRLLDENAQTFRIPSGTFTLRAVASEVSAEGFTFVDGFDADGNEIFGETTLAFVDGTSDGTQQYTKLPHIQKAITTSPVRLYAVDVDSGEATLIASYAPGETIPSYRQYSAAGFVSGNPTATDSPTVVSAICKLGFAPSVSANDLVIPSLVGALKLGLQALSYEDRTDPKNSEIYWKNAVGLLDAELQELQASEQPSIAFSPEFGCGSVRNTR